ncbi:hypothetical protein KR044_002617 [Drosophila immigrans]|nr:hypothetical protein KR044_002617 [Drosophila immigrans]
MYNEHKEQEQQQDLEQDEAAATTQNPSKRKRKRRKQQKQRRPAYDALEQDDDPYDYYRGSALPIALPQQQPLYYYGQNLDGYYDLRRLQAYHDYAQQPTYYDPSYYEESPSAEEQPEENVRKVNGKKYAVLRPLALAIKMPNSDAPVVIDVIDDANDDDDRLAANDEDAAVADDDVTNANADASEGETVTTEDSASGSTVLSESMRNAIGTYMRDDQRNRQRQRQAEKKVEALGLAKIKPRNWRSFLVAERLVNASNKRQ